MAGRPHKAPVIKVGIRVPETLYGRLMLLRPEIQAADGYTKYGAVSRYFVQLLQRDLEAREQELRNVERLPNRTDGQAVADRPDSNPRSGEAVSIGDRDKPNSP